MQPIVIGSINRVSANNGKAMPKISLDEAANLMNPKPKRRTTAQNTSSAKAQPESAGTTAFERAHPNAEIPAEQQRAKDWADAATPPPKKPGRKRKGLEELDDNDMNTGPKDSPKNQKPKKKQYQYYRRPELNKEYVEGWTAEEISTDFFTDAVRRVNRGMATESKAKAKATPGSAPKASTKSASTAQSPAGYPTWSYKLKTPLPLPSDIPATTTNSPPTPSPRPKVAVKTSPSRNNSSFSPIRVHKRPSPLAPKCMHGLRLTSQGECVSCTREADTSEPEEDYREPSPAALKCPLYPKCWQVPGKCYWCASLRSEESDNESEEDDESSKRPKRKCPRYPECKNVPGKCYWCAYLVLDAKLEVLKGGGPA